MSSLALMRWLESAPSRYDAGMRLVTLGRVGPLHEAVAAAAADVPGRSVLEIGAGTGAVTELLVARGARVTAVEQSPEMLEQARARLAGAASFRVEWRESTASEIDALPAESFDAVVASLSLSEMSPSERRFVLGSSFALLRVGGRLVAGDEVRPRAALARGVVACARLPQAALGWLLAGSLSRPIPNLAGEIESAGFRLRGEQRWLLGSLAVVVAERPR